MNERERLFEFVELLPAAPNREAIAEYELNEMKFNGASNKPFNNLSFHSTKSNQIILFQPSQQNQPNQI